MRRIVLLATSFTLLLSVSNILAAQDTSESQERSQPKAEHSEKTSSKDKWRERWIKHWQEEQAQRSVANKSKQEKRDVPPPVEDTLPATHSATSQKLTSVMPVKPTEQTTPRTEEKSRSEARSSSVADEDKKPVEANRTADKTIEQPTASTKENVVASVKERTAKANDKESAKTSATSPAVLSQTKPDDIKPPTVNEKGVQTQDNPFAAVGDGGRMLLYLVPMLLLLMGGLNLMRRFYAKHGRLPGALQNVAARSNGGGLMPARPAGGGILNSLVGGLHLHQARQQGGSNIRLVESIPLGGANLHLLEVRGRLLLLGATGGSVSLLAEWDERPGAGGDEFRTLLQAAAADMSSLDLSTPDLPARAIVGTLEEEMRDTGAALTRRARRLRTVMELEEEEGVGASRYAE